MATAGEKTTSVAAEPAISSEEGPASFFCRQCQSSYRQPKMLQCLHSFCAQCLRDLLAQAGDKTSLACPLCSYATALPPTGVKDLTSNSFLQRVSNEYVAGVKSTLASKSSLTHDLGGQDRTENTKLSPAGTKQAFRQEMEQHRFANMTDEQKFKSGRAQPVADSAGQEEAAHNVDRLQAKMVGLQGEALRVTCAIDRLNHHKLEWIQHREDMKRAIQRRSAQFQMLVKKMERQLLAQVDNKSVEDKLYESLETGKAVLRKNLKQVLHEVSVMKGVREMGNFREINELSPVLLSPSVGVGEVAVDKISYQLDLPTKSIDEMVRVGFGDLVVTTEERRVYQPELKDYAGLPMEEIKADAQSSHSFAFSRMDIVSTISGDPGAKTGAYKRSSSMAGRHVQRRGSDVGKIGVLEEFQNARESLRSRRQEILQQGQTGVVPPPWEGARGRLSRSTARRGRGQSLDRGGRDTERTQTLFKQRSDAGRPTKRADEDDGDADDLPASSSTTKDTTVSEPSVHREKHVTIMASPTNVISQDTLRVRRGSNSSSSSTSSSRRVSFDHSPSMSPTADLSADLQGNNRDRNLRRAITSAADKRSKMEFLRENWQKRKEILIQNQGFLSSEESKGSKPDSQAVKALMAANSGAASGEGTSKPDNGGHSQIPLASRGVGSPPLRSKFTSATRTQLEQRKYMDIVDSARETPGSPKARTVELPASVFIQELRQMEADRQASRVSLDRPPGSQQSTTGSDGRKAGPEGEAGEEEDEEVVVVETETITIPVTGTLLNEMKTVDRQDTRALSGERVTAGAGTSNTSTTKRDDEEEEEEEVVTEEVITLGSARDGPSYRAPQSTSETQRTTASLFPSGTSRFYSRTTTADPRTTDTALTSTTSTSVSEPLRTAQLRYTQTERHTTGVESADSPTTPQPVPSTTSLQQRSYRYSSYGTSPAASLYANTNYPRSLSTTSPSFTSTATTAATESKTSTVSVTTATCAAPSTTPSSTSTPSSPSSSSSTPIYSSRYSRRYVPKVEHIDIASLFSSSSKPAATPTAGGQARSKADDNKENIHVHDVRKATDSRDSLDAYGTRGQSSSDKPTPAAMGRELREDTASFTNTNGLAHPAAIHGVGGALQQNAASMLGFSSTITKSGDRQSGPAAYAATTPSPAQGGRSVQGEADGSTSAESPGRRSSSSMYSRFYTSPSTLYSQPPEPAATPGQELGQHHVQDRKVDETFTQAESTRRRYDPASTRAARNRRHTVEVSKTLPQGVKILDLYRGPQAEAESRSSFHTSDIIEESPTEAEGEAGAGGLHVGRHTTPASARSDAASSRAWRTESLYKQQSLPETSEARVVRAEAGLKARAQMTFPKPLPSPTAHLSASSSPAGSPMTEEKKLVAAGEDAASRSAGAGSKNLKEIARKKKERWRRLTVY